MRKTTGKFQGKALEILINTTGSARAAIAQSRNGPEALTNEKDSDEMSHEIIVENKNIPSH